MRVFANCFMFTMSHCEMRAQSVQKRLERMERWPQILCVIFVRSANINITRAPLDNTNREIENTRLNGGSAHITWWSLLNYCAHLRQKRQPQPHSTTLGLGEIIATRFRCEPAKKRCNVRCTGSQYIVVVVVVGVLRPLSVSVLKWERVWVWRIQ